MKIILKNAWKEDEKKKRFRNRLLWILVWIFLTNEIKDFIEKSVHIYKTIPKKSSFFVFKIINFVKIIIFSPFKIRGADLSGLR
jgi:hypothetical protein